jgi:hypothetical protein
LVQFAGPVKPEWFDELIATGVEIVNYVSNNAYLVYGNDEAMNSLQSWRSRRACVQWDGEYQSGFKVSPSVRAQNATVSAD